MKQAGLSDFFSKAAYTGPSKRAKVVATETGTVKDKLASEKEESKSSAKTVTSVKEGKSSVKITAGQENSEKG